MYIVVAKQLIVMALIVVVSFIFSKRNKFSEKEASFLTKFLMYVINPCVMLSAFNSEYSAEKLNQTFFVILVSFVFHIIMTLLAILCINTRKPRGLLEKAEVENNKIMDGLDRIAVVFTNSGFIGIPLIKGVFGDAGVFYLMGYILVFNVYLWTWGAFLMTRKITIKKIILNPNILAAILGLVLYRIPGILPYIISEPIKMIGDLNGAVSMILLGLLFAKFQKGQTKNLYGFRIVRVVFMRLVICPLALLGVTLICLKLFEDYKDIKLIMYVIYIASLCPVGMSVSGFAVLFGKDSSYTSLLVSISSAACIVTVPIFVKIAEYAVEHLF